MSGTEPVLRAAGLCCPLGESLSVASEAYAAGRRALCKDQNTLGIDGLPLTMAAVRPFGAERNHARRLEWLLRAALADCLDQAPSPMAGWPVWLLVQPWLKDHPVLAALLKAIDSPKPAGVSNVEVTFGEHAEGLLLLDASLDTVREGSAPAILVAAVDSYIHSDLWVTLGGQRRLFMPDNPHGFVPGEAACAMLVTAAHHAPSLPLLGRLRGGAHAAESELLDARSGLIGHALRRCLYAGVQAGPPARFLTDLNGERWRAEELGFAAAALGPEMADLLADPEVPALNMGNCGAATGLVLAALALAPGAAVPAGASMISTSSRNTRRRTVALIDPARGAR